MQIIKNNPYRILGLLAGASAREEKKQITDLKMYLDADQETDDDFSFPLIGSFNRTVSTVNDSAVKLNLESDKINAALFWFINGNEITDEPAFDALKDSSVLEALNIWSKLIDVNDVTNKNYSAFLNLSTYKLNIAFSNVPLVTSALQEGIILKLKFLESDLVNVFVNKIVGITFKPKKEDLQKYFLSQIQLELEKTQQNTFDIFLDIINKIDFSGKENFLKDLTQTPIQLIEKKIKDAREQREANKAEAKTIGDSLFEETHATLVQLKTTLGLSNPKFISISDELSNEVLQCGIDYFTYYADTNTDPSSASMSLFTKSKALAIGSFAKQRCEENTNNLQEWIDEKPEREKQKRVTNDVQFILKQLDHKPDLSDNNNPLVKLRLLSPKFSKMYDAKSLVDTCMPRLINIKNVVGSDDDFYLNISGAVVNKVQAILVEVVNEEVKSCNSSFLSFGYSGVSIKPFITEALDITLKLGTFDMLPDLKNRYNENLSGIKSLARQLGMSTLPPKERLQQEIKEAEKKLREIHNEIYLQDEKNKAQIEMNGIKEWKFLRSQSNKDAQIHQQQKKIDELIERGEKEKVVDIKRQQESVSRLKAKLEKFKD